MKVWRLLPSISAPMPFQLALDEILFRRFEDESSEAPLLRFYFSSEPWVTVGYCYREGVSAYGRVGVKVENPRTPIHRYADTKVCKRLTGGGRVEHGRDLIFSLVARKSDHESFKSVRTSYLKIHEAVKASFEELGRKPRFYRCDENLPKGQDCFRYPIATDLALGREKIAGGAQKRSSGALLHEESIPLIRGLAADSLMPAIRRGLEQTFAVRIEEADLDPRWMEEAETLAREKYAPEGVPNPILKSLSNSGL